MNEFTFADFCAGIGGFRIGLEANGGKCVYSCEIDKHACETYKTWFRDNPKGDIKNLDFSKIPDFDVLTAGFPCQSFSLLGKKQGFDNEKCGDIFFYILDIIDKKRPKILLLENVRNLVSMEKGKVFEKIKTEIEERNYHFFYKIINTISFVPQVRKRVYLVCFNKDFFGINFKWEFPDIPENCGKVLADILDKDVDKEKYYLNDKTWKNYLKYNARKVYYSVENKKKKLSTEEVIELLGVTTDDIENIRKAKEQALLLEGKTPAKNVTKPTLMDIVASKEELKNNLIKEGKLLETKTAFEYKVIDPTIKPATTLVSEANSSSVILIKTESNPRILTEKECQRLMGFPENLPIVGSYKNAHNQFGNAVVPPVIQKISENFSRLLSTQSIQDEQQ